MSVWLYLSKQVRVANDDEKCLGSTDSHVKSLWVGEEAEVMADIRVNQANR